MALVRLLNLLAHRRLCNCSIFIRFLDLFAHRFLCFSSISFCFSYSCWPALWSTFRQTKNCDRLIDSATILQPHLKALDKRKRRIKRRRAERKEGKLTRGVRNVREGCSFTSPGPHLYIVIFPKFDHCSAAHQSLCLRHALLLIRTSRTIFQPPCIDHHFFSEDRSECSYRCISNICHTNICSYNDCDCNRAIFSTVTMWSVLIQVTARLESTAQQTC